jgi:citrate lyase beta subunit
MPKTGEAMRHLDHIDPAERRRLFDVPPEPFSRDGEPARLAVALGATLYSPGTRPNLAQDIAKRSVQGVTSMVVCLEDAVAPGDVRDAEVNVVAQLRAYAATGADGPLLFIRVRTPEQIVDLTRRLGPATRILTGFTLPKFTDLTGAAYLDALVDTAERTGLRLLGMPVLESPEVIYRETRTSVLSAVGRLLAKHRDAVLALRIGATDLCGVYGLRRSRDLTIYDVHVVAEAIADIVNILGRSHDNGFVIAGPVWEYFSRAEPMLKPQLPRSPIEQQDSRTVKLRDELIAAGLDAFIREVVLDKANGLTGKTVIHPDHVAAVHALLVVTHEEFCDARDIIGARHRGGGVVRSSYGNKMNEVKPHLAWADSVMRRAAVFGVARETVSFVDLLGAGTRS